MINMIKKLLVKYKKMIIYIICGGLAAVVSMITYFITRHLFPDINAVPGILKLFYTNSVTLFPNIIAWIFAATFAYITNRIFVFESKIKGFRQNIKQITTFYVSRLTTLVIDMLIMFIFIDVMNIQSNIYELFIKILSNLIIMILNYVFSKIFVFKKS